MYSSGEPVLRIVSQTEALARSNTCGNKLRSNSPLHLVKARPNQLISKQEDETPCVPEVRCFGSAIGLEFRLQLEERKNCKDQAEATDRTTHTFALNRSLRSATSQGFL